MTGHHALGAARAFYVRDGHVLRGGEGGGDSSARLELTQVSGKPDFYGLTAE